MKAVICPKYGPPEILKITDVAKPVPKDDEVLIKVRATAVTASDIFIRGSQVPLWLLLPLRLAIGITGPRKRVIGLVLAGDIEAVGKNVKRFKPGDKVFGLTGFSLGAYAEYACMLEKDSVKGGLALKPTNISYEEATVAAYGGLLALQYLDWEKVKPGKKVLIYGASGTTGTIAVQLAKRLGVSVTAVCSTANLEFVKSLGADEVIDYTRMDSLSAGAVYDFIFDTVGKAKTSKLKKSLKGALMPGGQYASIDDAALLLDSARLTKIKEYVEAGYFKPVLDKVYKFEEIVEAHRYVGKGHKRGGVAVTVS